MYERFTSRVIKKLSEGRYLCTIPEANSREAVVDFGDGRRQLVRLAPLSVPNTFQDYCQNDGMLVIEGDEIVGWFFIGKVKATSEVLKFQSLISRRMEKVLVGFEVDGELYLFEQLS